jgi:hypothetical protein
MLGVPITAVGVRSGTRYSVQPAPVTGSVTPFRTTYWVSVRLTTYRLTLSLGPCALRMLSPFRSSVSRKPLPRVQRALRSPQGKTCTDVPSTV